MVIRRALASTATVVLATALCLPVVIASATAEEPTPTPTSTDTSTPLATETTTSPDPSTTTPPPSPSDTTTSSTTTSSPTPSWTQGTRTPPSSTSTSTAPPAYTDPPEQHYDVPLGGGALEAQIAAANQLRASILAANAQMAASMTRLETITARSNSLLQGYAKSLERERTLKAQAKAKALAARQAEQAMARDQATLRDWAFNAYVHGGSLVESVSVLDALATDPSRAGNPVGDLVYLTDERLLAFQRSRLTTEDKKRLAEEAVAATGDAAQAAKTTRQTRLRVRETLRQQRIEVTRLQRLHKEQIAKAGPIQGLLLGSGDPEALAASQALAEAIQATASLGVGGVGKPCSDNETEYPNGAIPLSALCPLWRTPGDMLRPRAAAAFNALSMAYAKDTGTPLCVTDSYRTYAEQVALKAEKGRWAATPGTSEHGRGKALDLCGGVQNFGHPAHLWMVQNAPLYGWYHPDWAAAGGSLPEPWHWEYAG